MKVTIIAFIATLFTSTIISNGINGNPARYPINEANKYFFKHDANIDGLLSNSELVSLPVKVRASLFKTLDLNKDGKISVGEVLIKYQVDANNDGYITKDELKAAVGARTQREMFKNIDLNGDGKFDFGEMRMAIVNASKQIKAESEEDDAEDESEDEEEDEKDYF